MGVDGASAISPILPSRLLMPVPASVAADAADAGEHGDAAAQTTGAHGRQAAMGPVVVPPGAGVTDGAVPAEGVPIATTATEAGVVDAAVVARLSRTLHLFADGDAAAGTAATPSGAPAPGQPPPGTPGSPFLPGVNESALASWIAASSGSAAVPAPAPPASRRTGVGRRPGSPEDDDEGEHGADDGEQAGAGDEQPGTGDEHAPQDALRG